jgi:rod shape-determining protein MreC
MSTREFFQRGPSPLVRLAFFCAFSLALIILDSRYHSVGFIRATLNILIYPAEQVAHLPVYLFEQSAEFFSSQSELRASNERLNHQLTLFSERAAQSASLEKDLNELRKLNDLPARTTLPSILAEVIHGGRNPFTAKLVLDRGSQAGLVVGQPVMDTEGLVGQITHVSPFSAEVTLVTEQNQQIPVRILRNGLRTLSEGDGSSGTLSLPFLPEGADIQTGDQIVTSGIDGTYPEGLPVAVVAHIERSSSRVFARVTCVPTGGIGRGHYVLVLKPPKDSDEAKSKDEHDAGHS